MSPTETIETETIDTEPFGAVTIRRRACPLCGRSNDDVPPNRYSQDLWPVKECRGCGFVYIDRAPVYQMQFSKMAWEQTTRVEERRRAELRPLSYKASKKTRFRKRILPKNMVVGYVAPRVAAGNVIDLGCGEGHALMEFPPSFVPFGIEISSNRAAAAHRAFASRGGRAINAACVDGLAEFPDEFFAAGSLRSYLEHEAEPLPVLRALHRVLAPDGIAVVKVPNYGSINRRIMGRRWCGFRYPDHLNYFTPETLRAMTARAGFATRFGPTGRLPTSDNMWAVLTKPSG